MTAEEVSEPETEKFSLSKSFDSLGEALSPKLTKAQIQEQLRDLETAVPAIEITAADMEAQDDK